MQIFVFRKLKMKTFEILNQHEQQLSYLNGQ